MTNINENSILISVELRKVGNQRRVNPGAVEVDADQDAIRVSKELLDSPLLKQINTLDGEIRRWVYARTLPSATLRHGVYRLPAALISLVDQQLRLWEKQRQGLVDKFCEVYEDDAEKARDRLRALYNVFDYPPVEQVRGAFYMTWRYLELDTPAGALSQVSKAMLDREKAKMATAMEAELETVRMALREEFANLVSHAATKLGVKPGGKKMIFRDSMVANMNEFLDLFAARNLAADDELERLVGAARVVMEGVDADALRDDETVRSGVRATFKTIKASMDDSLMVKPKRKIRFDDEKAA